MASGPLQKPRTAEQAQMFLRYLETHKLNKVTDKEELRDIYNQRFRPFVLAENLWEKVTNFSSVIYLCTRSGVARLRSNEEGNTQVQFNFALGKSGRLRFRPKSKRRKSRSPEKADGQDATSSGNGREFKGKKAATRLSPQGMRQPVSGTASILIEEAAAALLSQVSQETLPNWITITPNNLHCQVCGAIPTSIEDLKRHTENRKHRVQGLILSLKRNKDYLISNKEGIVITSPEDITPEIGSVRLDIQENKQASFSFEIKNLSDKNVIFKNCEMLKKVKVFTLRDACRVTDSSRQHLIEPGMTYSVGVSAIANHIGRYHTPLAFIFAHEDIPKKDIHIVRYLSSRCYNSLVDAVGPVSKYKQTRSNNFQEKVEILDGLAPAFETSSSLEQEIKLPMYKVPRALRQLVRNKLQYDDLLDDDTEELENIRSCLETQLCWKNYKERFSLLLHIEEIQMEQDIRRYDMDNVTMDRCSDNPKLLTLKVPGLTENRPSVLRGDVMFIRKKQADGSTEDQEYKAYVHEVRLNEVWLGIHPRLVNQFVKNMKFAVRFTFNRLPLRLMHQAVTLAEENSLDKILFPIPQTTCAQGTILPLSTDLKLVNKQLEQNAEQLRAIKHILAGTSRPAPYLVYGPPGTGKTVTIVEAMQQVLLNLPSAHILACAPSNSAADLMVQRLLRGRVSKAQVYRMCAVTRSYAALPTEVKEVSNYDKQSGQFVYPAKKELQKYRVIVTTLVTAGRLVAANFPPGHFSHIFIDESGHALEPETVIALAGIMESDVATPDGGQLVLAGDPEQLGPILRSPIAIQCCLDYSLLERFMHMCEVYERKEQGLDKYNPRLVTKLLQNYRSHPDILKLPNDEFYNGELVPFADKLERECLCNWEGLPKKGFPVVFHGVLGQDMREENSPSFFNPEEVATVVTYVTRLLDCKSPRINPKDIGVISPYRKQVQKLQKIMKDKNIKDVKVGSTEEFQGQESKIIIISTVRSNPEYLALDSEYKLGFLTNPKRFNVALTRAKALLIVIGNPNILAKDPHWLKLLMYCLDNGGYTGCDYKRPDDEMEDIIQRFTAAKLTSLDVCLDQAMDGISMVQEAEDPPWRYEN